MALTLSRRSRDRLTAMDDRLASREADLNTRFASMEQRLKSGHDRDAPLEREMARAASELQAIRLGRQAVQAYTPGHPRLYAGGT
jgi:hypothetical protein